MTLSIAMPDELESTLRHRAEAEGKDVATFVRETLEEKLRAPQTFAEILAPVHRAFADAGIDEDKATEIFEKLREEAWRAKSSDIGDKS